MKILMTTDNIGGVWTYSLELAHGLKQFGIEVVIAVTGNPLSGKQREELKGLEYYFGEFRQEWMDEPWADIQYLGRWLMEIANIEKPNLIHLNNYSPGDLNWNVPVVMTIHSCVLSWWEAVKKEKAPAEWSHYTRMVGKGMQAADILIAPSRAMMNAAEKYYGPFRRKNVIYNGRNPENFEAGEKQKIIFSMGRLWDEAKNLREIVEAAPYIDYPIYIAGSNENVTQDELPENVHLTGQLSPKEVAEYLSRASVYYLPVLYEPFGYTFLEAAYSGCALVGGRIDSLQEIWGDNMLYTTERNPKLAAKLINKLMGNEIFLNEYKNKAVQQAQKYTLNRMLDNYSKLYKYMLKPESRMILS